MHVDIYNPQFPRCSCHMSHAVEIVEPSIELAPDQNYKPRWMYSTLPSGAGPTSKLSEEKITPLMSGLFEIAKLLSCSWSSYSYMFLSITNDVNFTWVRTFYLDYTIHVDILLKMICFSWLFLPRLLQSVYLSPSRWTAETVPAVLWASTTDFDVC